MNTIFAIVFCFTGPGAWCQVHETFSSAQQCQKAVIIYPKSDHTRYQCASLNVPAWRAIN